MAGGSRSRDARPSQYLLTIRSYQILSDLTDRYESNAFKVGNYNWRLVFHPNGRKRNKGKNEKIYISLSLALDGTQIPRDDWNVLINFSFYVFNHHTKKYVTFSDCRGIEKKFDKNHLEHGCDEFLSIEDFKLNKNGYLEADSCTFGVDVLVIQPSRIMEVVSATSSLEAFTWTISDFEKSRDKLVLYSIDFPRGDRKWGSVYGKFKFTLIDQSGNRKHHHQTVKGKVDDGLGCPDFLTTAKFEEKRDGYNYILNDTVKVKLEIIRIYEVKMESI